MTHPKPVEAPAFLVDPDAEDYDQTLLVALTDWQQLNDDHYVQRIYDVGQVVGLHVHHRAGKRSFHEWRVLFASLLDLEPTGQRLVADMPLTVDGDLVCPDCGYVGTITEGAWQPVG